MNSGMNRSAVFEVYAVGASATDAIRSLGKSLGWGDLGNFRRQETEAPAEWFYRFTADGTSMKAAGEYVVGGAILTWWK